MFNGMLSLPIETKMGPEWVASYPTRQTNFLQEILYFLPKFCKFCVFSCRSLVKITALSWCEPTSSIWHFPSQKAYFQRPFRLLRLSPLFLLSASAPIHAISFPRLLGLCAVAAWLCVYLPLSSFHQRIQPVLPPGFCPNTPCHSSIMTAAFSHVSFYF